MSNQPPLSVRVSIQGSTYKIPVWRPAHENLRDICSVALTRHLDAIVEIEEDSAKFMAPLRSITVSQVLDSEGSYLNPSDTVTESRLSEGSKLFVKLKFPDQELSKRFVSLSSAHAKGSPHLSSRSLKSGSLPLSNRKRGSFSSNYSFSFEMKINGCTPEIGVDSGDLVRDCQLAVQKHVKKFHRSNKEDDTCMVDIHGQGLDLSDSVSRNRLSHGATLKKFAKELIIDATNNYSKANYVGQGGQATVYKGHMIGSIVAVKQFESRTDMEHEIEVLQKVRHPKVVLLMGYCPEENCIVSEFMEGGSLQDRLLDKPENWSWDDRYRVVKEIASIIFYLHSCDILHRDLKPANILFDSKKETAKVADMGSAKLLDVSTTTWKQPGTPGYMDPIFHNSEYTSKSMDIYSLGIIILQLCTHKKSVGSVHEILRKVPQGQKRNSTCGLDLFKEAMVAFDTSTSSEEMALKLLKVGLQCAEVTSLEDRPTLDQVIGSL